MATIRWVFYDGYYGFRIGWIITGIMTAAILFFVLLIGGMVKASYPGDRAGFEQVRQDASHIPTAGSEGIYRLVAEQNMELRRRQECNRYWYCGWSVDDRWDGVMPIVLPQE